MIVSACQHLESKKVGVTKAGTQRYRCKYCGKSWTDSTQLFGGMRIGLDRAAEIINLLCEGMAVRAVARITDTSKATILDLLKLVGERCEAFMHEQIRGVQVDDVQVDEIWSYVFCKAATAERKKYVGGCGDVYCYTAIERNTKLLVCWHHGRRDSEDTYRFVRKLKYATTGSFHLSSDGWTPYPDAIAWHLGQRVDYGKVVKIFREEPKKEERRKYSPGRIIGCRKEAVLGNPEWRRVATSHAERMNGSIRHFTKRMARLTCAFSKRWDNHKAALAVFFAFYNYCRAHRSLRGKTPAMAHGLANEVWTVKDLLRNVNALQVPALWGQE